MKEYFYKLAPIILAVAGLMFGICGYFIERYAPTNVHLPLWWGVILVQALAGVMLGRLVKKLYKRSSKDALTGLRNRRYFYKKLACEMERLKRTKLSLSLAIIDVDDFKSINDTYGHGEGDRVLTELSNIFKSHIRVIDTIARWGGEEFAIILPDTDIESAKVLAERIRNVVESSNSCYKITVCIGVTCATDKMDVDKFVASADKALYKAKKMKNKVVSMESSTVIETADLKV